METLELIAIQNFKFFHSSFIVIFYHSLLKANWGMLLIAHTHTQSFLKKTETFFKVFSLFIFYFFFFYLFSHFYCFLCRFELSCLSISVDSWATKSDNKIRNNLEKFLIFLKTVSLLSCRFTISFKLEKKTKQNNFLSQSS